jgi:CHAD domain-containing protein
VLTGDLTTVRVGGETECHVRLLEHLGGERRKRAGKLRKLVGNNRAELKSRLRKASAHVDKELENNEPNPASLAAAESLRLASDLEIPRRFNKGNLHPYRLKVKQLRYVLELAPDQTKFIDDLGEAKDAIGEWHDWEELVAIANDVLDHGTSCKLIRKLKETADSEFEHAVRIAEQLRRKYIKSSQNRKKLNHVRLSPAAIAASAALSEDVPRAA